MHAAGSSSFAFRNLVGSLAAKGYRCIAPDWLGAGHNRPLGLGESKSEAATLAPVQGTVPRTIPLPRPSALTRSPTFGSWMCSLRQQASHKGCAATVCCLRSRSTCSGSPGLGSGPVVLVVQGFVLGQFGLKWALQHPDRIAKLVVLNTPLTAKARLPGQLAAYKAPMAFMRPKGTFDGAIYNAGGSAYVME